MTGRQRIDPRAIAKVVRDPVHDYVDVKAELLPLINQPFVQRLRRVSQTSLSSTVYPSMTGRRFEHSLGTMHLAATAWRKAWANSDEKTHLAFRKDVETSMSPYRTEEDTNPGAQHLRILTSDTSTNEQFSHSIEVAISAAALLHDVGHPPYSHALEEWYSSNLEWIVNGLNNDSKNYIIDFRNSLTGKEFHEVIGLHLLSRIEDSVKRYLPWEFITAILWDGARASVESDVGDDDLTGRTWTSCLHELIAGEVDVDRLDYLVRDARNSGTEFGSFDLERLIQSLELHNVPPTLPKDGDDVVDPSPPHGWFIGFGARATSALESFINQRFQYYRWVVFHHHVVAANRMLNLSLHYLLRVNGVIDDAGRTTLSALDGRQFDYFASKSGPPSPKGNRAIATADDGTITEWIKAGLAEHRYVSDRSGDFDKPVMRFVALADAVIHRTSNWAPIWKTDGDYHALSARLYEATKFAFNNARLKFDVWKPGKSIELVNLAESRFQEIGRLTEHGQFPVGMPVPRTSIPYIPGGPVPFMNKIAEVVLSTDRPLGSVRLRREIEAANLFTTIAGAVDGHEDGFWVFAFDTIVPWRLGGAAAKVFKGEKFISLSEESGHALHWLEGVEAERAQFHSYFVSPHKEEFTHDEVDDIKERFRKAYPKFVYNALLQMFGIPG